MSRRRLRRRAGDREERYLGAPKGHGGDKPNRPSLLTQSPAAGAEGSLGDALGGAEREAGSRAEGERARRSGALSPLRHGGRRGRGRHEDGAGQGKASREGRGGGCLPLAKVTVAPHVGGRTRRCVASNHPENSGRQARSSACSRKFRYAPSTI
ncbi:hypothetical protein R5R35_001052 [Gryllus longicercus]|uniref:Uncharacterized protein n=1 Tax=Gryllus longicercus TaxID=2509291 RepID=A0AAN9YZA2_9ORTH